MKEQAQLEYRHKMLLRHHDSTRDLEFRQQQDLHRLRDDQLKQQHTTELQNQKEYTHRAEADLRRRHAMEVKHQPKSLKVMHTHLRSCTHT